MYEIPRWLRIFYRISRAFFTLLAVFTAIFLLFLSTAEYSGSGSQALDGILTILIVMGGSILFAEIITHPIMLIIIAASVISIVMYRKCRRELRRSGALSWESTELAWLFFGLVTASGFVLTIISLVLRGASK